MKSKFELRQMSKEALLSYRSSADLDRKDSQPPITSANNYDCHDCVNCKGCRHCFACRNAEDLSWAICNVVVGEINWKKKMKQLEVIK